MARKTFFSFHYKQDNWRASQVRNSWVTQNREAAGFFDSAEWEQVKKRTDEEIESWIDNQLKGTSVTVVLIGQNTARRKWIDYEIKSSHIKDNGLLGIHIHQLKNRDGYTSLKGTNPFSSWYTEKNGQKVYFTDLYKTYDWVDDDGYENMGYWIEEAARNVGK